MSLKEFNKMCKIVFILATISFKEFPYDIVTLTTNANMMTERGRERERERVNLIDTQCMRMYFDSLYSSASAKLRISASCSMTF